VTIWPDTEGTEGEGTVFFLEPAARTVKDVAMYWVDPVDTPRIPVNG